MCIGLLEWRLEGDVLGSCDLLDALGRYDGMYIRSSSSG